MWNFLPADSSAAEDVGVTQKNGMGNFSTSVPINVPQWGRQISHNIDISDETVSISYSFHVVLVVQYNMSRSETTCKVLGNIMNAVLCPEVERCKC